MAGKKKKNEDKTTSAAAQMMEVPDGVPFIVLRADTDYHLTALLLAQDMFQGDEKKVVSQRIREFELWMDAQEPVQA